LQDIEDEYGDDDIVLTRPFDLPFAPFPGLYLEWGDVRQLCIRQVLYDTTDGAFTCYPTTTGQPSSLIEYYRDGWGVSKVLTSEAGLARAARLLREDDDD